MKFYIMNEKATGHRTDDVQERKGQKSIETDRELEFARRTAAEMKSKQLPSQRRYMPGLMD